MFTAATHPKQDYDKRTPMHVAASEGKVEVLKVLVDKGADVDAEDRWQRTPLSDALEHRHEEVTCDFFEHSVVKWVS